MLVLTLFACGETDDGDTLTHQEPAAALMPAGADTNRQPPAVRYPEYPNANDEAFSVVSRSNPLEANESVINAGETLFTAMNCDGCHGAGGFGVVGPSLIDGRWRYGGDDSAVFQSIFYGRPKGMPAYGGMLNEIVVWQLISYLRAQPQPEVVPTLAWVE